MTMLVTVVFKKVFENVSSLPFLTTNDDSDSGLPKEFLYMTVVFQF